MSFSVIEIKALPLYRLLSDNEDRAIQALKANFEEIFSYISSASFPESLAIELLFIKDDGPDVQSFITIRRKENISHPTSEEHLLSSISKRLEQSSFSIERLSQAKANAVALKVKQFLGTSLAVITKGEKVVTTPEQRTKFYYTDIFEGENAGQQSSNYKSLFQQLALCKRAMISIQLIPSKLTMEERFSISTLASQMETRFPLLRQQMYRNVNLQGARKAYQYYAERATQPLFIGSILVACDHNQLNGLVSSFKEGLSSEFAEPIALDSYEITGAQDLSKDTFGLPWKLYELLFSRYRNSAIWGVPGSPRALARLPYLYTRNEAACFFRIPVDDGVIPGFKSNKIKNDNELLSKRVTSGDNIVFGTLNNSNDMIGATPGAFTRHALIVGAPGSGKTTFSINLLLQFHRKGIPFLVIEPTKREYRAMIDKVNNLQVFTPGKSQVSPFIINPFVPPKGIPLEQFKSSLMTAFQAAFSLDGILVEIFQNAIKKSYEIYGWRNSSTIEDPLAQKFGLFEFIEVFKSILDDSKYKGETKDHLKTAGAFRLESLIDQNKYVYDTINTIPIEEIVEKPTVIELEAIGNREQKALIMALLVTNICLYTKAKGSESGTLKNIIMIDEAHVLLGGSSSQGDGANKAQSTTLASLQDMISEVRSFSTGVIIADQKPSKVTSSIVADTDIKAAFRLTERNERSIIADSMLMSDLQFEHLARLQQGAAFVFDSDLDSPKLISTPNIHNDGVREKVEDEEIAHRTQFWPTHGLLSKPYYECCACSTCRNRGNCNLSARESADYYSSQILLRYGKQLHSARKLVDQLRAINKEFMYEKFKKEESITVINCTKIQLVRKSILEGYCNLDRTQRIRILKILL